MVSKHARNKDKCIKQGFRETEVESGNWLS